MATIIHPEGPRPKVVVVGLDGVPVDLLQRMVDSGVMPNLGAWLESRKLHTLASTVPPVSSVAWTTMYTGANPGQHSVFGFHDLKPGAYSGYFTNALNVQVPAIWDHAALAGVRSAVINVPQTYPARPVEGIMVAGFVAPSLGKGTYPPRIHGYLSETGYRVDPETRDAARNHEEFLRDLFSTLTTRSRVILHFMDTEPWDFFMAVITETDRLHHFLWHALEDPAHPLHEEFFRVYEEIDRFLGGIFERLPSGAKLILLSDHGFGPLFKEFYINRWLQENGYLQAAQLNPETIDDLSPSTRAFALDPSRIYIHLSTKYPRGSVAAGREYENLRDEIRHRLLAVKDPETGSPVVSAVYAREEIYRGPFADRAPDLVVSTCKGYDPKGPLAKNSLFGHSGLTGMHTGDDAFLILEGVESDSVPSNLEQVGAMVLREITGAGPLEMRSNALTSPLSTGAVL